MKRAIVGFHEDDEGHWVAELECGHGQHVRHDPPWQVRPWVLAEETRAAFLGTPLDCLLCDAPAFTIALAAPQHLAALPTVEREAARLFEGHAPLELLDRTKDLSELRHAQERGLLWVALVAGEPVGFALVEMLAADRPHLEEMDVHPRHGRHGIGTALLQAVCAWAARSGFPEVTLCTSRIVPWNMPFYAHQGFEEVPAREIRPEVAAVFAAEATRGLDRRTRVVMRRRSSR